ncbi:hypothetical protein BD324DRAFT_636485 [Kockovaella imperatae]|uniref:Uncharacterized protein n=1 Tax=Kockovaella imperatae TaxID=4999 RepID=A0A1Y1UAK2_9TREE|nr:hypothetical protein BD324DRAFT_636485 [Kockovaella imperatae]ORX34574.1 hypothetical protein BD324DRAFT_636485 [Kockovaella imperatae]
MNQAPAATQITKTTLTPQHALTPTRIRIIPSPDLLRLEPVKDGDIEARIVLRAAKREPRKDIPEVGVAMTLTVPTKWSPPLYDEDAEPGPEINPYDRELVLPVIPGRPTPKVNLLNTFVPPEDTDTSKIIMERREGNAGNFQFWSGGKITMFMRQASSWRLSMGTGSN